MSKDVVYRIVKLIPKGKVLTYKDLAMFSGYSNPRVIGNILHNNPYEDVIPCHRVVNSVGRLAPSFAFGGQDKQAQKLRAEGVEVVDGSVDLNKYLWEPSTETILTFKRFK